MALRNLTHSVVDPNQHHLDADPDFAVHFDADQDPAFHFDADPDPASNSAFFDTHFTL
jgi:hypothetical protein